MEDMLLILYSLLVLSGVILTKGPSTLVRPVCTENLNTGVVVVKSAQHGT